MWPTLDVPCCAFVYSSRDELDKAVRAVEETLATSTREDEDRVETSKAAGSLHTVGCLVRYELHVCIISVWDGELCHASVPTHLNFPSGTYFQRVRVVSLL